MQELSSLFLTLRLNVMHVPVKFYESYPYSLGVMARIRSGKGWSGGAMVLGKLPVPGRPTYLDYSRARAFCAYSRCGWGLFGHFFSHLSFLFSFSLWGWSGGAMVLGKLPVPGRPTTLIAVGQGPVALAVGAGGGGMDIFTLIYPFSSFSISLGDGPI